MSFLFVAFLTVCVFATSLLSGVFGMAGGLILMTILLVALPVQSAMTIHAAIQLVANGWRCWIWRKHIVWRVLPFYGMGIVTGFSLMLLIHYVPDKAMVLILMGAVPLAAMALEGHIKLSIMNRGQTFITATILTFIQMTAGIIGPLLDLLYNNAPLTRQQIISTKAFTQTVMHMVRLTYFGTLIPLITGQSGWPSDIPVLWLPVFLIASVAGTSAASVVVHRMNDGQFKGLTRGLIMIVCVYCLLRGLLYLWS